MAEENPNSLSNIMPKILARGLMSLRTRCMMPRLVNSDYGTDAQKKGSTIDVPVPVAVGTIDVSPQAAPVAKTALTPAYVQITMDQWKQNNPIGLSDKDLCEIDANEHFLPMQLMEAIKALASDVNQQVIGNYKGANRGVYGVAGQLSDGFGTDPFGSNDGVSAATKARKVLNEQLCPKTDRRGVVDFAAEANMLDLSAFSDADKILSAIVKIEGEIGRKYGIDWVADDDVPTHTVGDCYAAAHDQVTVKAEELAGSTALGLIDAGNGIIVRGDIIQVAGLTPTYTVTGGTLNVGGTGIYGYQLDATTAVEVSIYPALATTAAIAAAVKVHNTHVVNMAFHRDAFAFATRPLLDVSRQYSLGSQMISMQDPVTGLVLRLEVSRQHKQTVWEFDILWGSELIRPELATRIIGAGS